MTEGTVESMQSNLGIEGRLRIWTMRRGEKPRLEVDVKNLVVATGLAALVSNMLEATGRNPVDNLVLGTGSAVPAGRDTSLGTQVDSEYAITKSSSDATLTITSNIAEGVGNGPGSTGPVPYTEAGLRLADDTLFARTTFPALNKTDDVAFAITWTWTLVNQ